MLTELSRRAADRTTARRALSLALVLALVVTAGCTGFLSDDRADPVESVPEDQDVLLHVDMAVLEDETTMKLADGYSGDSNADAREEAVREFENETGLDPRGVSEILLFSQTQDLSTSVESVQDEQFGFVVHSDWSEDEIVSAINEEEDGELVATSYQGEEVLYEPTGAMAEQQTPLYLGVLGDGAYVIGTEQSVKGSLDVEHGDASSISGPVRETYDNARDGYVTFVMDPPVEQYGEEQAMMQLLPFDDLNTLSAVYYTEDGDVSVESRMQFANENSAGQVADFLEQSLGAEDNWLVQMLPADHMTVEQDGSDVVIHYSQDAEELLQEMQSQQL